MSSASKMTRFGVGAISAAANLCIWAFTTPLLGSMSLNVRAVKEVSALCASWMWAFRSVFVYSVQAGGQQVCPVMMGLIKSRIIVNA